MSQIDIWSLDLNLLKVFEALYEEGGAGRAAIRLGITQSAVSAALARLRLVYADHLFERTGRGLRPTAKSEELRPVIAAALEKCRQSLLLVNGESLAFKGRTVALGLSDDHELALGRRLIDLAEERAPGLRLLFRQSHSMLAADALMSRQIDLALTAGAIASRALGRQLLASGGYSCVSALGGELSLADYLRRGHVLVSSGGYVGVVDEALAAQAQTRRVAASTTHFAALPALLHGSDCIATLPTHAARALARLSDLQCLPCPIELPRYAVELGWRSDSARDPAIQLVLALVREAVVGLQDSDLLAPR